MGELTFSEKEEKDYLRTNLCLCKCLHIKHLHNKLDVISHLCKKREGEIHNKQFKNLYANREKNIKVFLYESSCHISKTILFFGRSRISK